jgi:D-tyrosyl-tRNA(Tyr) deacylase
MKAVLQRVTSARVSVDDKMISEIQLGLLILLGIQPTDEAEKALALARKCAQLRIFADPQGKMNLSALEVGGSALVVSQFTLMADTRKGNRPSFTEAASPAHAQQLVEVFCQALIQLGVPASQGIFGAHMQVELCNDGPVTILLQA